MNPRTLAIAATAALALIPSQAGADSISYVKDGDVWLSTADGSRQHRVTATGGYGYASQADDGTLIGLYGRRLHRLSPNGTVLADFATPVSFDSGPNNSTFYGPFDAVISPDGTKVAYTYYWQYYYYDPTCGGLGYGCTKQRLEGGTAYSHADRLTGWDEAGLGRQSGWRWPSWIGNSETLLSEPTVTYGNEDVITDTLGDGTSTIQRWFSDTGARGLNDGEMTTQRTKLAFVGTDPATADDAPIDNQVRVYRMTGQAPAVPQICFWFADPAGSIDGPSWSPDGSALAWGSTRGIEVGQVPDLANGCQAPQEGGVVLIAGGQYPDWGPADVPAAAPAPAPDGGGTTTPGGGTTTPGGGTTTPGGGTTIPGGGTTIPGGGTTTGSGLSAKLERVKVARALRKGLKLTVTGGRGRLAVTARLGRVPVARGQAASDGVHATPVVLAFTRKGRAMLRNRRTVTLRIVVTLRPADGTAPRTTTLRTVLRR